MSAENGASRYLGVQCQHCGESIPVPEHLMSRQILVAEGDSGFGGQYVSTLLNLRCKACRKEYFYDVNEICDMEAMPPTGAAHGAGGWHSARHHSRRHQ